MGKEQIISERFQRLIANLKQQRLTLSSAESCTGGGFGYAITSIAGSSAVYRGGCITYTKDTKLKLLHITEDVLEQYGVYSLECARAMAIGVCAVTSTDIGVSFTGVAGSVPDEGCPPGTVYIGIALQGNSYVNKYVFSGNRKSIRHQAIMQGAELIEQFLDGELSLA